MSERKLQGKTQKNQFLSFPIVSSSNEPRGRASHWGMNTSGLGQCQIFSKFFKLSEMKLPGKARENQFLSFPNISSSNEPRGRASHWGMNTSGIGQCQIFVEIFLSVRNEIYGKKPQRNQFLSFPNIISSNEPRGHASHCRMNSSGIGKSFFSKFSECQ